MSIQATVVKDSVSIDTGIHITTMQLLYPRFIHSEFMTHRVFSRNASSSRAVPTKKLIEQVRTAPALPEHWGQNQRGMQAKGELDGVARLAAEERWLTAAKAAADNAEAMAALGAHKQIVNRILEPFTHISVIVTATEWDNFFELRCHPDAQPEIRILAEQMRRAMVSSTPEPLQYYAWHLPYIDAEDMVKVSEFTDELVGNTHHTLVLRKISAARCARVSYLTHDGERPTIQQDLGLFDRLAGSSPMHASPLEHQAQPDFKVLGDKWSVPEEHRNFVGWRQFRPQWEQTVWSS